MAQIIASQVEQMFGSIAERYDVTNSVLSFGIHHWWKHVVVNSIPAPHGTVLDLCTGTGDLLPLLKRRFKTVIGADFCWPMLAAGKTRTDRAGIPLLQGDALQLPFCDSAFDAVTIAFGARNLESLQTGLREIRRVLRPGGHIAVLEFGQPDGFLFGPLYRFYSKFIMPRVGEFLTHNRDAYSYLPATAAAFPCGKEFEAILQRCGFSRCRTRRLTFGIAYLYVAETV